MNRMLRRLKACEVAQWAIAYAAAAGVVLQVLAFTADGYEWPRAAMHIAYGLLSLGFVVALVLAWYHGERGVQPVSAVERVLIVLVLILGGALVWQFVHARASRPAVPRARVLMHQDSGARSALHAALPPRNGIAAARRPRNHPKA